MKSKRRSTRKKKSIVTDKTPVGSSHPTHVPVGVRTDILSIPEAEWEKFREALLERTA